MLVVVCLRGKNLATKETNGNHLRNETRASENAAKCIRKQLAIWDQLDKNKTMDYAQCLCFLGEIYKDLEWRNEAIDALKRGIALHEISS